MHANVFGLDFATDPRFYRERAVARMNLESPAMLAAYTSLSMGLSGVGRDTLAALVCLLPDMSLAAGRPKLPVTLPKDILYERRAMSDYLATQTYLLPNWLVKNQTERAKIAAAFCYLHRLLRLQSFN